MRAIAATALLLCTTLPLFAADSKRDDSAAEKIGFKLGLQCYTFRMLSFFETVDKASELGIKYLEMYPGQKLKPGSSIATNDRMSDETIAEIKKKLADAGGLRVTCYGVAGVPNDAAGARRVFDWAKKLGVEVIVTETTPTEMHDKLCQEYNIRWALHNHPASWPPDNVLAASKDRGKLVGSCCDTGHQFRAKRDPVAVIKQLEGRIMSLHFKDLDNGRDVPWGTGKCDARGMLAELKRQGFQGYFSIEYETGSVQDLMKNLPQCVAFFDKTCAELAK